MLAALQTVVPSAFAGTTEAAAVLVLLSELAMLRSALSRSQVRLYAFQSLVVTGLAFYVAASRHLGDLYALAVVSLVIKVVVVPSLVLRLLPDQPPNLETSRLSVAGRVLAAILVAVFAIFVMGSLPLHSRLLPEPVLGVAAAVVLVAFLLAVVRADVVSQAVGFFSLENGVSVAGIVIAGGLPVIVEVALLFDLLVAVVVFGLLMRVHHGRARTLSTDSLDRLRG